MGASVAWGCMSVALAFPCAALLGSCAAARSRSFASGDMLARLARNGVSWTLPAAKRLAKTRRVQRSLADAVDLLGERGIFASPVGLLSLAMAAAVAVAAVVGALAQSPVAGVAVVALALACLLTRVHLWRDRQAEALRDAVPDALHAMGSCFQAGFSPLQTFQHLASELRGPLGSVSPMLRTCLKRGTTCTRRLMRCAVRVLRESWCSCRWRLTCSTKQAEACVRFWKRRGKRWKASLRLSALCGSKRRRRACRRAS